MTAHDPFVLKIRYRRDARRREVLVDDLDLLQAGAAAGGDERVAKRVRGEGGRADGG